MKILVSWLREFVDVPESPADLARDLSLHGFALEAMEAAPAGVTDGLPWRDQLLAAPGSHDDAVLDIEVTSNRPDAMSVLGIAREVATMYSRPLRVPARPARGDERRGGSAADSRGGRASLDVARDRSALPALALKPLEVVDRSEIAVRIDAPDLCARYAGAVADVTIAPSPAWMQARLLACGVRPIGNVVDITNYVLLELGQPMHAFDLTRLAEAQIIVRTARPGERIRTLDDQVRTLAPEMLVIADATRAQAVAGVMGGGDSEVSDRSRAIVFESAWFKPQSIRRTSRQLALRTEASMRFERGADLGMSVVAMERACALLEVIGAGRARGAVVDGHPRPYAPRVIPLRRDSVSRLLGADVPRDVIEGILARLGFVMTAAGEGWDVIVPSWRVDVQRTVDLVEEVGRHYGLDRLPATFPPLADAAPEPDPRIVRDRRLRRIMTGVGFFEALTFGFVSQPAAEAFADAGDIVPITNPLSETFAVLRPSVLPGLVAAVAHNRRRERRDVRLFEIGNRFSRSTGERRAIAFAWTGAGTGEHFTAKPRPVDFFDAKGTVELVCDALGLSPRVVAAQPSWLVAGRAGAVMVGGTPVGYLGLLAPGIADTHDLPRDEEVYVAELDLDALQALAADRALRVEPLPRFPSIVRDVSILVGDTLPAETVRGTIRSAAPPVLVRVREFDRYQGKGIPEGKTSLSLRLTFQSPDRTLTDAEVQAAMETIVAALTREHDAVQR